jgi:hypothetical protein
MKDTDPAKFEQASDQVSSDPDSGTKGSQIAQVHDSAVSEGEPSAPNQPCAINQIASPESAKNRGSKFDVNPVEGDATRGDQSTSIFENLDRLRLSVDTDASTGTQEILSHIPVRRPNRDEFFRVHPDSAMSLVTLVFDDKMEREIFLVHPDMRSELAGELKSVLLTTAITRQGVLILWPVALPDESGRRNAWCDTALEAKEFARTQWTRMFSDMDLRAYRISIAEGELSDPVWPKLSMPQVLKLAFRNRLTDTLDHPVVKRLRGLI